MTVYRWHDVMLRKPQRFSKRELINKFNKIAWNKVNA